MKWFARTAAGRAEVGATAAGRAERSSWRQKPACARGPSHHNRPGSRECQNYTTGYNLKTTPSDPPPVQHQLVNKNSET